MSFPLLVGSSGRTSVELAGGGALSTLGIIERTRDHFDLVLSNAGLEISIARLFAGPVRDRDSGRRYQALGQVRRRNPLALGDHHRALDGVAKLTDITW